MKKEKNQKEGDQTLRRIGRLVSPSSSGTAGGSQGRGKPVHFSLDGCPLSCCFFWSVATTSNTRNLNGIPDEAKGKYTSPCVSCLLSYHQYSIYCNKCRNDLDNSPKRCAERMQQDTDYRTGEGAIIQPFLF